jgi:hypothetical protein
MAEAQPLQSKIPSPRTKCRSRLSLSQSKLSLNAKVLSPSQKVPYKIKEDENWDDSMKGSDNNILFN